MQDGFVADRRVHHRVVDGAVRPFRMEILLDEIDALSIDGIHELLSFILGFAAATIRRTLFFLGA